MNLIKLSDRIWYSEYETERDRPSLGYIRGDHWSIAVDAGHSARHVDEFYEALKREDLPLPKITVITHWHWDHAFGMHRISGLSAANVRTEHHLKEMAEEISLSGTERFFSIDPSIGKEYAGGEPVVIVGPDIVFDGAMTLDPGGIRVQLITSVSPHTDDSTLVFIPEEKVLFLGDSTSGEFPTWEADPEKKAALLGTLNKIDADRFIHGHWEPVSREQIPFD